MFHDRKRNISHREISNTPIHLMMQIIPFKNMTLSVYFYSTTTGSLQSLQAVLEELDDEMKDYFEKIYAVKDNIFINDKKVEKMIANASEK